MLVFMVAAVCAVGNSPVAEAQMSVSVETDRAFVVIDLNTAEVLLQPQWGTLENTANGIVYVPDFVDGNDSFAFVADHTFLDVPVTFIGNVADGVVNLQYQYTASTDKDEGDLPNGTENPDGTITVGDGDEAVTGTIIQEPGTTIDFPEGTVIIGTDDSVDNDIAIIDSGEGSEIHTHDGVSSLDELAEILEGYPDDSIPAIVIVGHGTLGGGVSTENGDDIDGETIDDGTHQDLIDLINQKLEEDAEICVLGCDQFSEGTADGIQDLANATGHPVVANEDPVTFVDYWFWYDDYFYGQGHWVEVSPEEEEPSGAGDSP